MCPCPASYAGRPAEVLVICPGFLLPFGCRHSLFGSSSPRWGVGPSLRLAYRSLSPRAGPHRDSTFHTHELRPGWVPSRPRGRRCSCDRQPFFGRRLPHHNGKVPVPQSCFHRLGFNITRHHRGFTAFTRPVFPWPVAPGWNGHPWAFPPELHTSLLPATHVGVGTGVEHTPGTTQSTTSVDPPFCESSRNVRPRVARGSCW